MPHNLQKFKKVPLIFSIIFLVISLLLFCFLYGQINNNSKISQVVEGTWQTEVNRQNEIKSLDKSIKMISPQITKLETHFAESSNVVPFLDMIEKLAPQVGAQAQVSLVNLSGDHTSLVVDTQVTGSFESIYKYLLLLENSVYEIEFTSVDIRKADATSWSASFKIKLLSFVP